MSNLEFEPRIGKPRSRRETKSGRLTRMVVKAAVRQRAHKSPWANALTRRPVAELGRGKGALYGLTPPQRGWRRVTVKARIARHGTSDLAAARTHQHYIMRDGVTREGGTGQLYDREHDVADGGDFLERQKGDTYQFRLIVAPEDGGRMADLKPFVRDLIRNMEEDLATRLDWVAADHFNTGHPHTHIIIAGHDDRGQDLVMARHYISHGIRHRAQDLVTLELDPEQQFERMIKLTNEMKAERFTSLDRGILRDAKENVVVVSARFDGERGLSEARAEGAQFSMRVGRLRRLEQMGLAEEKRTGVWAIDPQLETKLRSLGERGDIMVIMNQVMRAHGIDRPAGDFAIFSGARKSEPVIGRVVEVGIADEMSDRKYLIVDSIDRRIHYAETGKLAGPDLLQPGMMVALSGGGGKGKMRNARIEVVSYWPVERLPTAEAATWLDQAIVADKKPIIHEKGFGADVSKALTAREEWLIANRHARVEQPGTITPKPDMLRELNSRGITVAAEKMSAQLGIPHHSPFEGMRMTGKHVATVELPMQRLAVIQGGQAFTLVPWRPELLKMHSKEINISVRDRIITMALTRGRVRDLGLSR
jgi:type IV secretory pathway VirD2 relaxase